MKSKPVVISNMKVVKICETLEEAKKLHKETPGSIIQYMEFFEKIEIPHCRTDRFDEHLEKSMDKYGVKLDCNQRNAAWEAIRELLKEGV